MTKTVIESGVRVTGPDSERFVGDFWLSWEAEELPRSEAHWTPRAVFQAMLRFKKRSAEAGRRFQVWIELAE